MIRRVIEVLVLPALVLTAIALPIPLMADRLPDPLATHWGLDGTPDGSLDGTVLWIAVTGVWAALWALIAVRARKGAPLPEAVFVFAAGGFLAGLMAITVAANDGAETWQAAGEVGVLEVLLAVVAGLLVGSLAALLERGREHPTAGTAPGSATIGLAAGEQAVWVGGASNPVGALAGPLAALLMFAGGLFADGGARWTLMAAAVVVGLAIVWVSTVRVTASERGLRVAFGPFGFPTKSVPLERIERVEAIQIEPLRWGGWGYRRAGLRRSAAVVRRGPGLVLDLRGGARFAVTVDEPAPAAGLLNDLLRRDRAA